MGATESVVVGGKVVTPIYTQFLQAVISGNLSRVKATLTKDIDINKQYQLGHTAVYFAALKGHDQVVDYLIQRGANIRIGTHTKTLPVHIAAWKGYTNVLKVLIKHGADVLVKNSRGKSPFYLAVIQGDVQAADLLMKYGVAINDRLSQDSTLLYSVVWRGDLQMTQFLVSRGACVNVASPSTKNFPVHHAAWCGHAQILSYLLQHGAMASCRGANNATPLHLAVTKNHPKCVSMLLDAGADKNVRHEEDAGRNVLHKAAAKGYSNIVFMLLNHGAELESIDTAGMTALHLATYNSHNDCVLLLLQKGANKNAKTAKGSMPITFAKTPELKQLVESFDISNAGAYPEPSAPPLESLNISSNNVGTARVEGLLKQKTTELNALRLKESTLQQEIGDLHRELDSLKNNAEDSGSANEHLECPICFEVPHAPLKVYQCIEGHIFCETCVSAGISHCPECRTQLQEPFIRNRRLEDIIKKSSLF